MEKSESLIGWLYLLRDNCQVLMKKPKRNKVVNGFCFYCKNTVFGDDAQDIKCRKICQSENVHKIHTKVREMTRLDLLG